ncbi:pilus assembly protein PilM [Candidatus Wolfebacteria bacterium]|nr:pilus assembly protein PilM [Candidatus Wolfebacteria bacterium]
MFNFFKKNFSVGIDISDSSIEILRLNKQKEILSYGRIVLESGIVQDGKILKKDKFVEKLKEVFIGAKPRPVRLESRERMILSLPESKTFIHYFEFPEKIQGADLRQKVFEESSKIIPFDQSMIIWDFLTVPGKKVQRVLYIGAIKDMVLEIIGAVESLGVKVEALDLESLSLGRALIKIAPSKTASLMIMDIGSRTTILSVFDSREILNLSVNIPVAGDIFTKKIAEKLNIQEEEADKLKISLGFDKSQDNKILELRSKIFEDIIKETQSAIRHYEEKKGEIIEEIILAGGTALMPKISDFLAEKIGKNVRIGNPLENIKAGRIFKDDNQRIFFGNVIGLALRGVDNGVKGINLLSKLKEFKKEAEAFKAKPALKPEKDISDISATETTNAITGKKIAIVSFLIVALGLMGFIIYKYVFFVDIQPKKSSSVNQISVEKKPAAEIVKETPSLQEEKKFDNGQILPETENSSKMETITQKVKIQDTPTGWLNVRKGPGSNFDLILKIYPGEFYVLLEEKGDWYKIKIDEKEGWINSQYASKE